MSIPDSTLSPLIHLDKFDTRIPPWEMTDLLERVCPICTCGGTAMFLRPDGLQVCRCTSCETFFVSPAPSERQLNHFYATYSVNHQRLPDISDQELAESIVAADPLVDNIVIQELASLTSIEGKRCLDVGFGHGAYLHNLRTLGGIPVGVDLDQEAVDFARHYLKIDAVSRQSIFEIAESERFDIILMTDVVEHPLSLFPILQRVVALLNEGGLLAIWTPNGSNLTQGKKPTALTVDLEHMQYLSYKSCSTIAAKLDLQIVHLESCGFPALTGMDQSPVRRDPHKRIPLRKQIKSRLKRLVGSAPLRRWRQIRNALSDPQPTALRDGKYHLFCIFMKNRNDDKAVL